MPNCVQLFKRGSKEPTSFQVIDAEICEHFNVKCDEKEWHHDWYNLLAFFRAMGKSHEWIKATLEMDIMSYPIEHDTFKWAAHMLDIELWLNAHYTSDAWYELKR